MEVGRKDFHHPFEPYEIQNELMAAIYDCIAEGKVGIFESPTGTGKSLSLICASLTWLRDFQAEALRERKEMDADTDEPSWVIEHATLQRKTAMIEQKLELEVRLRKIRAKESRQKELYENCEPRTKKVKLDRTDVALSIDDDARFELEEYNSDEDGKPAETASATSVTDGLSATSVQLMEKLGMLAEPLSGKEDVLQVDEVKVFYCSRTHSQLTQFVHEVRRVRFPPTPCVDATNVVPTKDMDVQVTMKHLPLGSRKSLCINPEVTKLGSAAVINERCLELQQPNTPKEHRCLFLPNKENQPLVNDFRDYTLAKVRDIEDLGQLGKRLSICPYYAARSAIKPSELVTLPYPLLLQKSAREALDISLKGHVVIIDEAHNLMDAISNIHSIKITQLQLKRCRAQLGIYLQKFRNKLKGKNRVYVTQVVRLLDSLSGYLESKAGHNIASEGIVSINNLMTGKGVDQINLVKLMRYLVESRLARKIEGYINHAEENVSNAASEPRTPTAPVLTHIQSFLEALTNPASEGRFIYERDNENGLSLKYMLLDPTHHFRDIVEDARAVILAGGTMSPMDDYVRHLFEYVKPDRLKTWSCGHIIPKDNLIVWPVAKGPRNVEFDFTFVKRNSPGMIDSLGNCLIELSIAIPDGLVVFFPSYSYLDQVIRRWQQGNNEGPKSIWDGLLVQKPIFRESKETSAADDVLQEYSKAIADGKGGLLLSVIGGKMSEGINFSDKLGRGVVVVGLPFPNIQSPQWKAKLEYIEKSAVDRGGSRDEGRAVARDFYENACMRAVNQSIGRSIRHQKDFASIILLDRRYRTQRIAKKLPEWIRQGLVQQTGEESLKQVIESLQRFFKAKGDA